MPPTLPPVLTIRRAIRSLPARSEKGRGGLAPFFDIARVLDLASGDPGDVDRQPYSVGGAILSAWSLGHGASSMLRAKHIGATGLARYPRQEPPISN